MTDDVETWRRRALVLADATEELVRIYRTGEAVIHPDVLRQIAKIEAVHAELRRPRPVK